MRHRRNLLLLTFLATIYTSYGQTCQMEGVNFNIDQFAQLIDTHDGVFFNRSTTNIEEVISISLVPPYVHASLDDSVFTLSTTEAFSDYEEYETSQIMYFGVNFRCTTGVANLMFQVSITDTNNHSPVFRPTDVYEFTVAPPLPPGFQITGCGYEIIARDVDLTTQRVDFSIEENPFFEIAYDPSSANVTKEFRATLRTKTMIRNIPETIVLTIYATDYDTTGDPRRTTSGTLQIDGTTEFQLPDEPIFSQAFYSAYYTATHDIILEEPISLQQGDYENVHFSLEGDNKENFDFYFNGNDVSLVVIRQLSAEALSAGSFVLVVRAEMEYTSGATTTVIVQLPEVINLEFEQPIYEGLIVDNTLQLSPLVLTQGYENGFTVTVISDHSAFFTYIIEQNVITMAMEPLDDNIINANSFINLQVMVSSGDVTATAVLTLDIVKDDRITPVFESAIYTGNYDGVLGLSIEPITLGQGYDDTVSFSLDGDHRDLFEISNVGPVITMTSTVIPPEYWIEKSLVFSIKADKPRTVGANAVVVISFPSVRAMGFEESTYVGTLEGGAVVHDPIILHVGYDPNVNFEFFGDYLNYFEIRAVENRVSLHVSGSLPENIISENNFLIFTISATGVHAATATTTVLLEIIKQDDTTPVFSQSIYHGNYLGGSVDIQNIVLSQGDDNDVQFGLEGAHSEYFDINRSPENQNLVLSLVASIPDELIFNEKVLLFNVFAEKPLTVRATAAISINFPRELTEPSVMRFSESTYIGFLEDDSLAIETITLETGYAENTEFILSGVFSSFFEVEPVGNLVTLIMSQALPPDILQNNEFIVLELEAQRERAISVTTSIIITIVKQQIVIPLFDEAFYQGVFTAHNGLHIEQEISLSHGYDSTVTFGLRGELAPYFTISDNEGLVTIGLNEAIPIPDEIVSSYNQILLTLYANKPGAIEGRTAISIDLPKEQSDPLVLRFEQTSYVGSIDDGELQAPTITLPGVNLLAVDFVLRGDYAPYFTMLVDANGIQVELANDVPANIYENTFVIIDIEALYPNAISGYTCLALELIKESTPQIVTPVFEQAYYTGEFSQQGGLLFEGSIQLIQGFNESVTFTLQGDDAEWFEIVYNDENDLSLKVIVSGMPQIENRCHLVFSILANKPYATSGHSVVIISLTDVILHRPLRFSQNFYTGSIEDGNLAIDEIILIEGYRPDLTISFTGDHVEYFQLTNVNGTLLIQLTSDLPNEIKAVTNVLVYTIEVQFENTRAHTTVVVELLHNVTKIVFSENYYTGHYTDTESLVFENVISLEHGYDESVQFSLEGDHSQWFELDIVDNFVLLRMTTPIPPTTIANNHQLIFVITAQKPGSLSGTAAIIISLLDDYRNANVLGFEKIAYQGSIENNAATMEPIILSEGFSEDVLFTLLNEDYSQYFNLEIDGPVINILLVTAIPEESIPNDRIILIELRASVPGTMPASASLVFGIVQDDDPIPDQPKFGQNYYTGHYIEEGLVFENGMSLEHGYDESVQFSLEGDHSQWFELDIVENFVLLRLTTPIPPTTIANNHQLIFVITAQKPGSLSGTAAIVISLLDDYRNANVLGFEKIAYQGSIENNAATMEPIILSEGFSEDVLFTLRNEDYSQYFNLEIDGPVVNIILVTAIPEESIPNDRIILLELRASVPGTMPASASLVFGIVQDDDPIPDQPKFGQTYYTGHYIEEGLVFENGMSLGHGYDESVQFSLEGDHSQWFELDIVENFVLLRLTTPIPPTTIANNHQLIFVITAQKPGSLSGTAAIVISLLDDYSNANVLGFEKIAYQGSIENNAATMEPIILSEGFSEDVLFTLRNEDYSQYFNLEIDGPVVNILLVTAIPEESIPNDRIILLELRASVPGTMPASASLVFGIVQDDDPIPDQPKFGQTYYTGHYIEEGLVFENGMSLGHGYDESVQFSLEGDHSQWFELDIVENFVLLRLTTPIPPTTIANNHQLIFVITAQKPGSLSGTAAIVISLLDDYSNANVLGFEKIAYQGSIENNAATMEPIILSEGFSEDVLFTLRNEDYSQYFNLEIDGPVVNILLVTAIPEESIPNDRIILLELRASVPGTMPASASLVFGIVQDDDPIPDQPKFGQTYYTGHYIEEGLVFENGMSLGHGYDESVQFSLEGDHSQWFELDIVENFVLLRLTTPIPPTTIANNHQLIFVITAQKPGSLSGTAAIVISLLDDYSNANVLGFEKIAYQGSIENNAATMDPIILSEGFSEDVLFTLRNEDYSQYFNLEIDGPVINILLVTAIPEESIPNDRIILLELRASVPGTMPASASLVFGIVQDDDPIPDQPKFGQTYYTGHYIEEGLVFENGMSLGHGYDESVQFSLEGDHSQWFELDIAENFVLLRLTTPIPPTTIANNHQLIFVITAQKPESLSGTAAIVISLLDDYSNANVLGFEKIAYQGSIENNAATMEPIILSEGFSEDVLFTLRNEDYSQYFNLEIDGPVVNILLVTAIPEESIPNDRIILLELRASVPGTMPASASLVFGIVQDDDPIPDQPKFGQTYYTGHYIEEGLVFENGMSLGHGYDESVQFSLEGDHSQWFELDIVENFILLRLTTPIPPTTIANNHQLIFVITAQKPGSLSGTAAIVISLLDDYSNANVLGFEKIAYQGSVENNAATMEPIILSEGFSEDVLFTLRNEDYSQYFNLEIDGPVINILLVTAIPEESIPNDRIILLELRASVPGTMPASASLVFGIVQDDDPIPDQPKFGQTYYTGHYIEEGLVFENGMSLGHGYDESVQFSLEGDHSQWFELDIAENFVLLRLTTPIPPTTIANNHQLIFVITAQKPESLSGTAAIVISLLDDYSNANVLGFEKIAYQGSIENNAATMEPIILSEGFSEDVLFTLRNEDYSQYFNLEIDGPVINILLVTAIPEESIPNDRIILLELRASVPSTMPASASLVFGIVQDDDPIPDQPKFGQTYYTGHYIEEGLVFENGMSLGHGYDESVQFSLEGDHSQWFELDIVENFILLRLTTPIPPTTIANNHQLIFVITAQKPGSLSGTAAIVISLLDDYSNANVLGFEKIAYQGSIENNAATIEPIILSEGFSEDVLFTLRNEDYSQYFNLEIDGPVINILLVTAIPEESIPNDRIILLELRASVPGTMPASASLVFGIVQDDDPIPDQPKFGQTYYTGHYIEEGLVFENGMSLGHGYDESVQFSLEGDHSQWFELDIVENFVLLRLTTPIPPTTIANNHQLIFVITAQKPGSLSGTAAIVISLLDDYSNANVLGFEKIAYQGSIENNAATMDPIILSEGFSEDVLFTLRNEDYSQYFNLEIDGPVVNILLVTALPEESIPNDRIILLELRASVPGTMPASASLVFGIVQDDDPIPDQPKFGQTYYTGHYIEEGLVFENGMSLGHGYDESVQFSLEGDHSQWFELDIVENFVLLRLTTPIPPTTIANNHQLIFVITAHKPGSLSGTAAIVISLLDGSDVSFGKVLYEGNVSDGQVQHETITLLRYDGTDVELSGEYAQLFVATTSITGVVEVRGVGSVTLSEEILYIPLELRAGFSRAVLLMDIDHSASPQPPTVTFSSPSYELRVDVSQTGVVGRVAATADNGEFIAYSLIVSDEHLMQRLSVDREGQLSLSAPANSGVHSFQVVATTVFSQITATAPIRLTVDAITTCSVDGFVLPPLIVLDRDEEEPHTNLVTLTPTQAAECRFRLTNRWPLDQNWLYVDDTGLHTRTIDREHESIASMALSQVQVQLILECDSDNLATRAKRSLTTEARQDWLGPYDYGSNKWILTDTILYNSRRSLVNLIVNDINDNAPVFVGKQNEPIVVGYPVPELEEIVLPRALAELKATDADVGENARLMYWSSEDVLAVSPSTGSVHVRHNTRLENNARLTVSATDRNGEGLTGSIDLLVKLLDSSHIVVVRVGNAILDDEDGILSELSTAVGYEIKLLSSAVISDEAELDSSEINSRKKRDLTSNVGALLQLFIYGLDQQQPVLVEKLTEDINNNVVAVSIASILSLEDHLDGLEICNMPGRDVGLLAATIVLSVLLFLVIVAAVIWFFLKWRKKMNYRKLSDLQSQGSPRESPAFSNPEKTPTPRLNIEELKRSERRLQERLGAPIPEVSVRPSTSAMETPVESKINIPVEEPQVPIVIQSIDKLKDVDESTDDDEFGERKPTRKKSVVTFNENVEKIIHVEDTPDDNSIADYGVYKL